MPTFPRRAPAPVGFSPSSAVGRQLNIVSILAAISDGSKTICVRTRWR